MSKKDSEIIDFLHNHFQENNLKKIFKDRAVVSDTPFKNICIDNFFQDKTLLKVLQTEFGFPEVNYETKNESRMLKRSTYSMSQLGKISQLICMHFNSSNFVSLLETTFQINHLIPDPHIFGGGYHETKTGGFLKVHADNNWDTRLLLNRRLNLIYYMNPSWKKEWGGDLELWSRDMTKADRVIEPFGDRLCLFVNHDYAFHGHPEPLKVPASDTRKSIAMYYYSTRPSPENKKSLLPHSTIYQARPNEKFRKRRFGIQLVERFVPPILTDVISYWKNK